jgi:hypothetical protein
MPRKPKTPQSLLAAVDAYEAANSPDSNQSNSVRARESAPNPSPNPMRQALKELNSAAWHQVQAEAFPEAVKEKQRELADLLEEEARAGLLHASKVRVTAGYGEAVGAVSRNIGNMRLLREQATSISTQAEPKSVEERDAEALRLLQQVQLRVVNGGG